MPIRWARTIVLTVTTAAAALCAAGSVGAGPMPAGGAGSCMPWPENDLADEWAARVDAVGAHIAPGEVRALIIVVRRTTDAPATIRGFDIAYADAGRSHHVSMGWDIMLVTDVRTCPGWSPS